MPIRRMRRVCRRSVVRSFAVLACVASSAQLAYAQNQAQNQPNEEIIVTGSRVSHSGFDSPQPLTTLDDEQIKNLGLVNTGDVLRKLPQNTPFFTETNVGIGNFNVGSQLANLRGLNPFFGTRTLTLVDTKRVVPTSEGGAVDLTLIPSMLVQRTEVVTGGASAAYGSDAIAGVVNVILDKKLEGMKAQIDFGETGEGDGGDSHASFAWGTGFGDNDRGHVIAGIEYQKQDTIGPCSQTRDWCKDAWLIGTNAAFATNHNPAFYLSPGGKQTPSENGTITPCLNAACTVPTGTPAPAPFAFNPDGTALTPFNPGVPASGFAARIGGDGTQLAYDTSNIRPEVERYSAMGRISYDVSDRFRWFAELAYAHSDSANTPANGGLGPGPLRIQADNAFLTPGVSATLGAFGGNLNRIFMPAVMSANNTTENTTTRFVTGIESQIGEKWNWDAYVQHGENENHQRLFHNMVGSLSGAAVRQYDFLRWALDAVHSNPADPTSPIVCRATLPTIGGVANPTFSALAAGCVPLNIMGNGHANPAAIDYAFRTLKEDSDYKQDVLGVNFRSNIAEGWAGPISFATGLEWRSDKADTTHDIPNQPWYSSYFLSYGLDRGGTIDVLEAYGEVQVPMSKKLQTDFAARETHNDASSSTSSNVSGTHDFASWKASAIYDPLQWLRFRATLSKDVRAAGFRELFLPRVTVQSGVFPANVTNPWAPVGNPNRTSDQFFQTTGGYPGLEPETADTTTFGTVFTFDKWRISADWFEIDLKDAITQSPGNQQLVDQCFRSGGGACDRVTGFGTPDITAIDSSAINLAGFLTRGVDFETNYNLPMRSGGSINLRLIATYLYDMIVNTGLGAPPINYHGQSGPVASFGSFNTQPDWQGTAWVTYARNRFTTTLETRWVGPGKLNATWFELPQGAATATSTFSVTDNTVSSALYLSWSGSFDFQNKKTQLFWVVNNLLDRDPPVAPGGNAYPTNPVFFDTLGRRVRVGVRFAF